MSPKDSTVRLDAVTLQGVVGDRPNGKRLLLRHEAFSLRMIALGLSSRGQWHSRHSTG
jgi:hypothetical protein